MPRSPMVSQAAMGLRESVFSRLAGRLAAHPDPVPLHLGDTHLLPPSSALLLEPHTALRYGAPAGAALLCEKLLAKLERQNGMRLESTQLQITCGATQALAVAARVLLDPGDEVITPTPHWPLIRGILGNVGAIPIEVELSQRLYADATLDPAALLLPHIGPRTSALYLATPNNPDGKVLSKAQLGSIAALAIAHDLWVIADEVYEDLLFAGTHYSIAALPGMAERTVTAFSLSKSLALAGYRLGYLVGPANVMRAARKVANHTVYNVPEVLQLAAAHVLGTDEEDAWRKRAMGCYEEAAASCALRLSGLAFVPDGATYFFLDLRAHVTDGSLWPLVETLLEEGVSVSPGEQFGSGFAGHTRICFAAVPLPRLELGLDRLRRLIG